MRTFLRLITVLAAFGMVAGCAGTDDDKKMMSGGDGAFKMDQTMMDGHKRLLAAISQGGIEKSPAHAATAQKEYDCWVDQAKANQQKKSAACRNNFYGAMALLEADIWAAPKPAETMTTAAAPPAPPRTKHFLVFFDLNSAAIAADEGKAISAAAQFIKANEGANIYVTGHTDQSGSNDYNMALSKKRTDAVVGALTGMGVSKGAIGSVAVGENDPAVSRSGRKDERNRRVVIAVVY